MYALIPAAGIGSRMGSFTEARAKVMLPLSENLSVLQLCIESIVKAKVCRGIILAVRAEDISEATSILSTAAPGLDNKVIVGGETRQQTVYIGLTHLSDRAKFVLIHDGARPFCSVEIIQQVANKGIETGAAIVAIEAKASLKQTVDGAYIKATIVRRGVWEAQTPQVFRYGLVWAAHEEAIKSGLVATDDSELVERLGHNVSIVPGSSSNIKITTPEDLKLAQLIYAA